MRDVEQIIQSIVAKYPAVNVQQLQVRHPGADDDGLWFFNWPGSIFEVQIESSPGMSPFLIETMESDTRIIAASVDETIRAVLKLLHLEP
jgi:hypothetical protein